MNKYEVYSGSSKGDISYIFCTCNKISRESKGTTKSRTNTSKPDNKEDQCNYRVSIKKDETHKQWYIRQNAGHILQHSGHIPVEVERREQGTRNINNDTLMLAEQMLERNVPKSVVKELVEIETGQTLSNASLSKIRQSMVINKYKQNEQDSTADALLRMMDNDPNIEYCAYIGSMSEAEKIVRVRKRSSKKKGQQDESKSTLLSLHYWTHDMANQTCSHQGSSRGEDIYSQYYKGANNKRRWNNTPGIDVGNKRW
jgi:hypothetical protein